MTSANRTTDADANHPARQDEADSTSTNSTQRDRPIVFFDGVCGMCNRTVDFLLTRDRNAQFLFAPLQGETAKDRLPPRDTQTLSSIVLHVGNNTWRASAAVCRILWKLGGCWSVLGALLWLIPWPVRELGYKVIAVNRYRWFGKKEACRMPTPDERERFLP